MPDMDPRESLLRESALALCTDVVAGLRRQGMPLWLAYKEAEAVARHALGMKLSLQDPPITDDDVLFDVRQLSAQFRLEHDGSALHALLCRYDYAWKLSDRTYQRTERTLREQLAFWAPFSCGKPRLLWKPAVVGQVIALEQARQALDGLAPGEPDLLRRYYLSPREWGQPLGRSTRAVNQRLAGAGWQTLEPHRTAKRWKPSARALEEKRCIFGARGLEWLPEAFTEAGT